MSTILVDNLTGKTSAGSITVTSEGGAATQSLQQGLAKAWVNFNGSGTISARDSFNFSGLTDNGTGDYTVTMASAMANDDYCITVSGGDASVGYVTRTFDDGSARSTTAYRTISLNIASSPAGGDGAFQERTVHGDLA